MILDFLFIILTLSVRLFSGLMMTLVFLLQRQWEKLNKSEYVIYFRGFLLIAKGNSLISVLTFLSFLVPIIMGIIYILNNSLLEGVILLISGSIFFIGCFIVTMKFNFPIYNEVISWSSENDSADWEFVRKKFYRLNIIRMFSSIASFFLIILSIL
jgi:uncharacterized membrane protein